MALAVKIGGQTVLELLDHKVRLLHIASAAFPPTVSEVFHLCANWTISNCGIWMRRRLPQRGRTTAATQL